ncbi:MAG: citrate/2-methylcitrate synthase, partial [Acidobacteriia bacterium]|nr:citrate/2-methylcitrate synthase [Terriglobia bacterium]
VEKIKDPARADRWIRQALADKARIMGFGHRVYRVEDPRAKHLKRLALELGRQAGSTANVEILDIVARVVSAEGTPPGVRAIVSRPRIPWQASSAHGSRPPGDSASR